ncbi:MAG: hypothetical protein V7K55_09735 [Nostoc sp.]|uniref:carboxymuconolactone decarboxylase family protein n=1 Tax=Nostoc sp. TaxID=1180 RepID=UPI002FF810CA
MTTIPGLAKLLSSPSKSGVAMLFTKQMIEARGWVNEPKIEEFLAAGYTKQQVLEVILGIAVKIIHNYTNHIAKTPLDKAFQPYVWSKPAVVS